MLFFLPYTLNDASNFCVIILQILYVMLLKSYLKSMTRCYWEPDFGLRSPFLLRSLSGNAVFNT